MSETEDLRVLTPTMVPLHPRPSFIHAWHWNRLGDAFFQTLRVKEYQFATGELSLYGILHW